MLTAVVAMVIVCEAAACTSCAGPFARAHACPPCVSQHMYNWSTLDEGAGRSQPMEAGGPCGPDRTDEEARGAATAMSKFQALHDVLVRRNTTLLGCNTIEVRKDLQTITNIWRGVARVAGKENAIQRNDSAQRTRVQAVVRGAATCVRIEHMRQEPACVFDRPITHMVHSGHRITHRIDSERFR